MSYGAGDIVLLEFPQASGQLLKLRPALVLATLPGPYQTLLLCGISTQLQMLVHEWDEVLASTQAWFPATGLRRDSVLRLSFLSTVADSAIAGRIGSVPGELLTRQRARLGALLSASPR